ncbi:head assembly [Synechococcus phage Syn5]|uniref:Scaffolding protein n=1 Tax=Synechococcus phage Syn5 TaxID=2914003 RepID=A4ZRB9_9CAUD|nr:head assembly [Synechococcus phage Syn5]ABP87945.1 scaffolding protein [Synechococcus phage Syn5]
MSPPPPTDMANTTFDVNEGPSDAQKAAEAQALEIGEKLAQEAAEQRDKAWEQNESEDLIGGKFKTQEDLLKAYQELERQRSEAKEEVESEDVEESTEEVEEEAPEYEAFTKAAEEYANGELSEETIEALSQMDSKDLIQQYVQFYSQNQQQQAQVATQQADTNAIFDSVGGQEAYGELIGWAANNLEASEVESFNSVTATGNTAAIKFAVEALNNRYKAAEGYEAPLVTGRKSAPSVQGYRSNAELARDIGDPRYATDPAFRADVEARLARSGDLL